MMNHKFRPVVSGAWIVAVWLLTSQVFGVSLDNARVIVPGTVASAGEGTVGAFTYNPANDTFYTTVFGKDSGLRTIVNTNGQWEGGWGVNQDSYASDMSRFMHATDVPMGLVNLEETTYGSCTPSGILLNPVPLTIDMVTADASGNPISDGMGGYVTTPITYAAGELAYIIDLGSEVRMGTEKMYQYTKKMYRWDLRTIGAATSVQPDFATGGSGYPDTTGSAWGALNQADWNDVLSVVFTEEDLRNEALAGGGTLGGDNIGRQFTWSSDGLSMYAVESSSYFGGVYKIDACTGDLDWIYHENSGNNVISEPTVVATAAFDFTGGTLSGDQIIFDGTEDNGNDGGLSYVVHDGTNTSSAQVLLNGADFREWAENDNAGPRSITHDSAGNVYFYAASSIGLFAMDTEGRVACIFNKALLYEINQAHDGTRDSGGGMLRLQVREDGGEVYVLYRGDNKYIGEVDVPVLGDLTGDDVVDPADCNFMIEQYKKSCYATIPTISGMNPWDGEEAYLDYITADMNGSGSPTDSGSLENVGVTFKDVETLAQFVIGGLEVGDLNWDGIAADAADWAIFDANYGTMPTSGVWSWFDGDMDFDGDVDDRDRVLMSPLIPGDANKDGKVDGSDVTILANHWQEGVSGTGNVTWEMGDFNGDGKVDGSDVTILANHWQEGVTTTAASVPEPSTIVLLVMGIGALLIWRRK